jgi:hypothetical protein
MMPAHPCQPATFLPLMSLRAQPRYLVRPQRLTRLSAPHKGELGDTSRHVAKAYQPACIVLASGRGRRGLCYRIGERITSCRITSE